jgi:hypothetical protein
MEGTMEDRLWRIFENVNNWLKYAEQKNTLLLTFIGIQITLVKLFMKVLDGWLMVSLIFLGLCFIVCLLTFFPRTRISNWWFDFMIRGVDDQAESDNLIFFGHIVKYTTEEYIAKMQKYLNGEIHGHRNLENLCSQIVVNSEIASAKLNFFKVSVWLMVLGQFLFLLSFWSQYVKGCPLGGQ